MPRPSPYETISLSDIGNYLINNDPHTLLEKQDVFNTVHEIIEFGLDDREKFILQEIYFSNKSARATGIILNLSTARIQQLKKRSFEKIRKMIDKHELFEVLNG